jgi:hypothetical protein
MQRSHVRVHEREGVLQPQPLLQGELCLPLAQWEAEGTHCLRRRGRLLGKVNSRGEGNIEGVRVWVAIAVAGGCDDKHVEVHCDTPIG